MKLQKILRILLKLNLWRPCESGGMAGFADLVLPKIPDIKKVRSIITNPHIRPDYQTETCGTVLVKLNTVLNGFKDNGCLI